MADAFSRQKMRWLNSVFYSQNVTSTACRVAYVIADHLNRATRDCWLAHATIARKLGVSAKTVQRSIRSLKDQRLLSIRYAGAESRKQRFVPAFLEDEAQVNSVLDNGRACPGNGDVNVHQSFSGNLTRSDLAAGQRSSPGSATRVRRNDRGRLEVEVARRLGGDGFEVLDRLAAIDDSIVCRLCEAHAQGALSAADLDAARLAARQAR
jgi:Helix-turn-helix domain